MLAPDLKDVKVVLADDHPMLLQGLKDTLVNRGLQVLDAVGDGTSALQAILQNRPDIAILDIEMPFLSGFSIAEECHKQSIDTRFIILSYHKEAEFIAQAKSLNISGYLLKEDTQLEIFNCITAVMNGEFYFSPSILNEEIRFADDNARRIALLSPSEKKILKMIATQASSQHIANKLHVSERTIEKHRSNIISKLNLTGQANALSLWAIDNKNIVLNL